MTDLIQTLKDLLPEIHKSIRQDNWDSLIINRRKPFTYRVFRMFGDLRVCLHAFDPCEDSESFEHPHAWPAAFLILKGGYVHRFGTSEDLTNPATFYIPETKKPYDIYKIDDPKAFHSVQPLERTYTIMINGVPYEKPHAMVRTTKGKDLEKFKPKELQKHLAEFDKLLEEYWQKLSV